MQTYSEVQELLDNTGRTVKENDDMRKKNDELLEELEAKENLIEQLHNDCEVTKEAVGEGG